MLSLFLAPAYAQAAEGAPTGGLFAQLFPLILIIVIFYFLLIRPQQKRAKEHKKVLSALAVGDEVITGSGMLGKVVAVEEQVVSVNIAAKGSECIVKFQKQSIQAVLPAGTMSGK